MITLAIDRPEHTRLAGIEMTEGSRIASPAPLSTRDIEAIGTIPTDLAEAAEARSDGQATVVIPLAETEWTKSLEKEFGQLADQAIQRKLSTKDKGRFAGLTLLRQRLQHPRLPSEILYEQERTEVLFDLVNALSRCVKFIDANVQNLTRSTSKEKNSAA